jgi:hypothetical protein
MLKMSSLGKGFGWSALGAMLCGLGATAYAHFGASGPAWMGGVGSLLIIVGFCLSLVWLVLKLAPR